MAEHHGAQKKLYESYELKSSHVRWILISMVAIFGVAILSFVSMWGMILGMEKVSQHLAEPALPMVAYQKPYSGLLIQSNPPAELKEVKAEVTKTLAEFGWVDKDTKVVHMPIDHAMDQALKRGFPVWASKP